MKFKTKPFLISLLSIPLLSVPFVYSCSDGGSGDGDGGDSSSSYITLSGQISGLTLNLAASDYTVNCVTFEETPRAQSDSLDSSGNFEVQMFADISFGCFLLDSANEPVATMVVSDGESEGGLGSDGAAGMSLSGSVDLGTLTVSDDGKIAIPPSKIASVKSTTTTQIVEDDVHNSEFTISCSGISEDDDNCQDFVEESPSVFFRLLKATEDGIPAIGLGVWASEDAFNACGNVDLLSSEAQGVSFTQGVRGSFSTNTTACPVNDDEGGDAGIPEARYALGKLFPNGGGYSFYNEYEWDRGEDCTEYEFFSVDFTGGDGVFYGLMQQYIEVVGTGCTEEDEQDEVAFSFVVEFEKIEE